MGNNDRIVEVRGVVYRISQYEREFAQRQFSKELPKEKERSLWDFET